MTLPKTLLEMAGVKPALPSLDTVAVVLIDMQMGYLDGGLPLPDGQGGVVRAETLHRVELAALADRCGVIVPDSASLTAAS